VFPAGILLRMDKNKFFIALIVFIVVFGSIYAAITLSNKTSLEVIDPQTISTDTQVVSQEEAPVAATSQTSAPDTLLGTEWGWSRTEYMNGSKTEAPAGKFVITFGADKTLSSTTDCNSLHSKFILDDEILSIGPIASTKMACSGETLEAQYTQELSRATSHVIKGNELRINLYKDTGTMVFFRRVKVIDPTPTQ